MSRLLRRSRSIISISTLSLARASHLSSPPPRRQLPPSSHFLFPSCSSFSRSFFTSVDRNEVSVEESSLPVRTIISLLDGYHDFTGLPWWIAIASSTVAMRFSLLPILILQLQKLKRIGELGPKLPPPLPPPMSGRSYIEHFSHFRKERKTIGCPSFLWFLASFSVQVPCFLLWVVSIRRMSLDHHPGFDCGGALWFQNLTELPHGVLGLIFPFLTAGLHYTNVQIGFLRSSSQKAKDKVGLLGLLVDYYKTYLDILTVPIFFISCCIPQGSLVYWVTNSSFSLVQQLSLKNPTVRAKLGLPDPNATSKDENSEEKGAAGEASAERTSDPRIQGLSPKELVALSVKLLSREQREKAFCILKLALDKDPEYVHAMLLTGQVLMQKGQLVEASEYLERAISKLCLAGYPTNVEDVDFLILSSMWAGVVCMKQGKKEEGFAHMERIANMPEPEDPKNKAHYFDGLLLFSSALLDAGRKAEALKYLHMVVAYDPSYEYMLEQIENQNDNFETDLVNTRRRDY